ncbi:MAG: outer membrane beta-barrel protein [Bacteroidales bacterium]|nr:outer membrane beta-barrel protein [Bacteroidales bacterium]
MKRFCVIIAAILLSGSMSFAQIVPGAGYVHSTISYSGNGSSSSTSQSGFFAGASMVVDIPAVNGLGFVPGLYFSLITESKQDSATIPYLGTQSAKSTFTEMAFNVPTVLKYSFALSGGAKVFAYAGPTFQLGLSSKTRVDASGIISGSGDVNDYYSDDVGYNRFNVLVGGGVGFVISRIMVNLGYDYGVTNTLRGVSNASAHRSNLHLGVGYIF